MAQEKTLIEILEEQQDKRKGRNKNLIVANFDEEEPIILAPLGDIHLASPECNEWLFLQNLEEMWENPLVHLIGMGDWLEAATRSSVGAGVYEQRQHAGEQLERMVDYIMPFAQQGRVLGITNGNHEDRIYQATGVDVTRIMARMLDVPYFHNGGFFLVKNGKQSYDIYATHGSSGAKLPYTKPKQVLDLARFIGVDMYLYGHVHDMQVHTQEFMTIDKRSRSIDHRNKYFILTGHYLNWQDGYAQAKNMIPSRQGTPLIHLSPDDREIRVEL
jgi:UDP-2,3-diacylglucosamine pyrophosphatase LpxH